MGVLMKPVRYLKLAEPPTSTGKESMINMEKKDY